MVSLLVYADSICFLKRDSQAEMQKEASKVHVFNFNQMRTISGFTFMICITAAFCENIPHGY